MIIANDNDVSDPIFPPAAAIEGDRVASDSWQAHAVDRVLGVAAAILQVIMFNPFAVSIAEEDHVPVDTAGEEIWQQLLLGLPARTVPEGRRRATT